MSPPTLRNRKRACGVVPGATGKQETLSSIKGVPGCRVAVAVGVGVIDGVKVVVGVFDGVKVNVGSGVLLGV